MFGDIFGQAFRDATGMPSKVTTFDIRLKPFKEIIEIINQIKEEAVKHFEQTCDFEWSTCLADEERMKYQMLNGIISSSDYTNYCFMLGEKKDSIIGKYVDSGYSDTINALKGRLSKIKIRGKNDEIISLMCFDTWVDMLNSLELANVFITVFESSDEYTRAKQIAEITKKIKYDRHIRRG